jgi:hypothetical protein
VTVQLLPDLIQAIDFLTGSVQEYAAPLRDFDLNLRAQELDLRVKSMV